MGIHNSLTEFYLGLYCRLFGDLADRHKGDFDCSGFDRDFKVVRDRTSREGLSFLTKTLPLYGKALDKSLATGEPLNIDGLIKQRYGYAAEPDDKEPGIPMFLGSLWFSVFSHCGVPRTHMYGSEVIPPDEQAIRAVKSLRQVFYLLYKLRIPFTNEDKRNVLDSFVEVDSRLGPLYEETAEDQNRQAIIHVARALIARVTSSLDPYAITPRHGPGVVATGEKPWEKMRFKRLYQRIDDVYPYSEYMFFNINHLCDEMDTLDNLESHVSGTAKVVLVPKDSRGPRLISCEPLEYQWMQQGLARALVGHIEHHPLTRGQVNFTCQQVNRTLALLGSSNRQYVTLDMKEASDRVSVGLVKDLFPEPLLTCLLALRTEATLLPDGRTVTLNKFAPMGSALCFPVEALCFWALAVAICHREHYAGSIERWANSVFVYGDDIIVKREVYASLLQHMPLFGLMFNEGKCCTEGFFRESCGVDAYGGTVVTPLKIRSVWSSNYASVVPSYTSYYAWLVREGYHRTASYVRKKVEAQFERLPVSSSSDVDFLHWYDPDGDVRRYNKRYFRTRFNRDLQQYEIFALRTRATLKQRRAHDWGPLLQMHSRQPDDYGTEGQLPGVYAVPHRSYLKRGWSRLDY